MQDYCGRIIHCGVMYEFSDRNVSLFPNTFFEQKAEVAEFRVQCFNISSGGGCNLKMPETRKISSYCYG